MKPSIPDRAPMDSTGHRVALLLIGDELLDGRIADTNGPYFATRLREHGVALVRSEIAGDSLGDIVSSLRHLLEHSDFVICAGGIGPTVDDRTRQAVADALAVDLVEDYDSWTAIVERFERSGRQPSPTNRVQALHPRGSNVLPNPIGTAPGFVATTAEGQRIAAIPGVPAEARAMFEASILPLVAGAAEIPQHTMLFAGVPESKFGELLAAEMHESADARVGITAAWSFLKVTVRAPTPVSLGDVVQRIRRLGAEWFVGDGSADLEGVLVEKLRERGETVSLAESCTGGLVAARLTRVPGCSEVFRESYVTYHDEAKTRILAVPAALLAEHGAVSEACVRAMVEGLAVKSQAEICGAVSGIAGPGGGSAAKPVGLVHFAVFYRGEVTVHVRQYGDPGRDIVRERASSDLLLHLLRRLLPAR